MEYIKSAAELSLKLEMAVIDMGLEDIPGLELCRRIKAIDSRVKTIIVSNWGVNLYKSTLEDAGVDAVLNKPFRLEQLQAILAERGMYYDAAEI